MGYTTEFNGNLTFDKPLTKEQVSYIRAFNQTRRMKRNAEIAETLPDKIREAVSLPIGDEGAYYVGGIEDGQHGQKKDKSIIDYNQAPGNLSYDINNFSEILKHNKEAIKEGKAQPGLWCQWTVSDEGTILEWDEGEKFYNYIEWLKYLITHFFEKWNVKLNGEIKWRGEDFEDMGIIKVEGNNVTTRTFESTI